jgi:hypothetical protein
MLLLVGLRSLGEEAAQRRLELRARVVLAVGSVVERASVDLAVQPRCDQVGNVVQQLAPLRAPGELEAARALDQLVGVAAVGGRGAREKVQLEKKTL